MYFFQLLVQNFRKMLTYRKDVDGLRAISVLIVIIFHAFPGLLQNGYIGVDVFFVISGYLISSITFQELERGQFSVVSFYLRRIKRIFPAALIVLFVSTLVAVVTLQYSEFLRFKNSLAGAAFFYLNYQLDGESGYFDISSQLKPLMHYWSLAVEEQFYLLWPACALLAHRYKKYWKLSLEAFFLILISSLTLFLFTNYFLNTVVTTYHTLEVRAWELMAGVGVTLIFNSEKIRKHISIVDDYRLFNLANLGMAFLFAGLFLANYVWSNVFAVLAAVCFLLNGRAGSVSRFLSSKGMVGIGLASYSLYLWHWPFLSFLRIYKPNVSAFPIVVAVAISSVFAFLTYYYVERPMKSKRWYFKRENGQTKSAGLVSASALTLCFVVIFASTFQLKPLYSAEPEFYSANEVATEKSPLCILNETHKQWDPQKLSFCFSGKSDATKRGLIVGDSHADAIFPGLSYVFNDIKWSIVAQHSCMPFIGQDSGDKTCGDNIAEALKYAVKEKFSVIVFANANRAFKILNDQKGLPFIKSAYEDFFKEILDKPDAPPVVLIEPVPEFKLYPQQCAGNRVWFVQRFISETPPDCEKAKSTWNEQSAALRSLYAELKAKHSEVQVFDPASIICSDSACSLTDSKYYYKDQDHLNTAGSTLIMSALKDQLIKKGTVF